MTKFLKKDQISSSWFEIDAKNAVVGRLATVISKIIRGKNKTTFTPHMDDGDFVVVKNIEQINIFNERNDNGFKTEEPELRKAEISFHLGGSYALNDRTSVDLRHSYSLFSIRDYPVIGNPPSLWGRVGWFNRLFSLGISYNLKD